MDEVVAGPKTEALRDMYWRGEILQVMYWLRGEGLGDIVDAPLLERFLGVDAAVGLTYLDRLVDDGYLEHYDEGYVLSPKGLDEGATEFGLSFADLTRPSHGDCSPSCWCHLSPEEADACHADQSRQNGHDGHGHEHG